jgi:hypothetical protein
MEEEPSMEQLAFGYWTLHSHPELFDPADRQAWLANPKIKALHNLATQGPQLFLRGFEVAWNSGYIRR